MFIANLFLSYIIGVDEVLRIISEPISKNFGGFIAMLLFSGAFYFVFSWFREQVCVAVCPYGRLQGVMLDKNSIVVAYDLIRGEPRGKMRKKKKTEQTIASAPEPALGDCIDCKLCVQVCPTGIDIRNGTQLECVNCTACIDACDEVMDKIDRDRGLIRYDSHNGIAEKRKKIFTPRVIAYSCVLGVLLLANVFLLSTRSNVEALILRTKGMLYQRVDDTHIQNQYEYHIVNKTQENIAITFKLATEGGTIKMVGDAPTVGGSEKADGAFFIIMDEAALKSRKENVVVEVYVNGELLKKTKTSFSGPMK